MGFHNRADGVMLTKMSGFRKMWPFMMPTRTESTVYTSRRVRVHNALEWLDRINIGREEKLTLFHVILAACVRMLALRPDINRFVSGRRFYQRRDIQISFVVRREMQEKSTETIVKMTFDPRATIDTIAEQVNKSVYSTKKNKTSHDEKFADFLTLLPRFVIRSLVGLGHILDYFGLLPAWYIKKDTMFTSVFMANLGSIQLDAIFHPMFEWGTASFFIVIGKVKKDMIVNEQNEIRVEDVVDMSFSVDQRITGGFNFSSALMISRDLIQNPEALLNPPDHLPDPFEKI